MSELTKSMLAFDELIIASRPLDPPEGDATDDEVRQRRQQIIHDLTAEQLVDMLCDDPDTGAVLWAGPRLDKALGHDCTAPDLHQYVGRRICEIMAAAIDEYVEVNE